GEQRMGVEAVRRAEAQIVGHGVWTAGLPVPSLLFIKSNVEQGVRITTFPSTPLKEMLRPIDAVRQVRIVCPVICFVEKTRSADCLYVAFQTFRSGTGGFCRKPLDLSWLGRKLGERGR